MLHSAFRVHMLTSRECIFHISPQDTCECWAFSPRKIQTSWPWQGLEFFLPINWQSFLILATFTEGASKAWYIFVAQMGARYLEQMMHFPCIQKNHRLSLRVVDSCCHFRPRSFVLIPVLNWPNFSDPVPEIGSTNEFKLYGYRPMYAGVPGSPQKKGPCRSLPEKLNDLRGES